MCHFEHNSVDLRGIRKGPMHMEPDPACEAPAGCPTSTHEEPVSGEQTLPLMADIMSGPNAPLT